MQKKKPEKVGIDPFDFHLVSVAHKKTLPVLEHSQHLILSLIRAKTYTVIVPGEQVHEFRQKLDPRFHVESEDRYVSDLRPVLSQRLVENPESFGWYLQQFIKLAAVRKMSALGNVLIWDADTVPLRKLRFFSRSGVPSYFTAGEHHPEYFLAIERALGLAKQRNHSFIAQCFPIARAHAVSFFSAMSRLSSGQWWQHLVDSIDFSKPNAFSEYETLGTYVSAKFPDELNFQRGHWLRNGWLVFSDPEESTRSLPRRLIGAGFSYCSFELHQAQRVPLTLQKKFYNFVLMFSMQVFNGLVNRVVERYPRP